jgi:hypothetical protein
LIYKADELFTNVIKGIQPITNTEKFDVVLKVLLEKLNEVVRAI